MPTPTAAPRGRLTPEREAEIYTAVLEELSQHGYERLNFDAVAERARCSKATLYRLWDGKLDLVVCALTCTTTKAPLPAIDTGSLRGDLRAWADEYMRDHSPSTALVLGLARTCLIHPDLAEAACRRVIRGEAARLDTMVDRAVERGEVPADAPGRSHVVFALAGPALLHDILDGTPVTTQSLYDYIDAVMLPCLGIAPDNG